DTSISTRGPNRNNWILGYQPDPGLVVGGRNGLLRGTLAVNHVTETGDRNQVGRVIIGQIHAESDEPARLYYRKFPENERGFIYLAHEIRNSDDIYFPVVGPVNSNLDNAPADDANPVNGIALDEIFSYEIKQQDARIDVIVRRGDSTGPIIGHNYVDMRQQNSGYDVPDEWMYFKAGAYTQNNTGDGTDFDQVTFYELENSHDL
ncbi:MAG: polysaccharide lyase family 7 protein, partial [Woeseiaceae bacterium]